jgi:hypothetical protein
MNRRLEVKNGKQIKNAGSRNWARDWTNGNELFWRFSEQSFQAKPALETKTKQVAKTEHHRRWGKSAAGDIEAKQETGDLVRGPGKIRILAGRHRTLCGRLGGENLRIDKTNVGQKFRSKLATHMRWGKIRILAGRHRTQCGWLGGENLRIDKTNVGQKSRSKLATRMRQWFKRDQKTQRDLQRKGKLKQRPQKY